MNDHDTARTPRRPLEIPVNKDDSRWLGSVSEPAGQAPTASVIDLCLLGTAGSGKTQFAVSVIRTLRASMPILTGAEAEHNREILRTAVNPAAPRPASSAGQPPRHYTLRLPAPALYAELGLWRRARLLCRMGLLREAIVSLLSAVVAALAITWLRGSPEPLAVMTGAVVFGVGLTIGWVLSRQRLLDAGDVEVVLWDVAGSEIRADGAADYHQALARLVQARTAHSPRGYAFAPVVVCNPLELADAASTGAGGLPSLVPVFAELGAPHRAALIAINRWRAVDSACAPDSDRDATVTVVEEPGEQDDARRHEISREALRAHCVDAEGGTRGGIDVAYLRYDADDAVVTVDDDATLRYRCTPHTRGLEAEPRKVFLDWLADLAFRNRPTHRPVELELPFAHATTPVHPAPRQGDADSPRDDADTASGDHDRWQPGPRQASETLRGMTGAIRATTPADGDHAGSAPC